MGNIDRRAKVLWSLTASGAGTTLSADGNSGTYGAIAAGSAEQAVNAETAIDLRDVTDVTMYVTVGGVTGSPNLVCTLTCFDDLGNPYAAILAITSITGTGTSTGTAGLHGTPAIVLPSWGEIGWAISGGTVTGTEICLYGR